MPKPFKFRYVNEIVGGFVMLVVALLVVGVILAGNAQEWFTPVHVVRIDFPEEGSLGVQKGSPVMIMGTEVGRMGSIHVREDGSMFGRATIKGDFIRYVRKDSKIIVKRTMYLAGDAFIEITRGKGEELDDTTRLQALPDTIVTKMLEDMLTEIRANVVPLLGQIRVTAEEYGALAADLRNTEGPMMKLIADLEGMAASIKNGEGSLGKLLKDPAMADEVAKILKQVNDAADQLKAIMADIKKTTVQLPSMASKVGGEVRDSSGLMLQTQATLRETERLIDGIQNHWLIRKYIPQPKSTELIPAGDIPAPPAKTGGSP